MQLVSCNTRTLVYCYPVLLFHHLKAKWREKMMISCVLWQDVGCGAKSNLFQVIRQIALFFHYVTIEGWFIQITTRVCIFNFCFSVSWMIICQFSGFLLFKIHKSHLPANSLKCHICVNWQFELRSSLHTKESNFRNYFVTHIERKNLPCFWESCLFKVTTSGQTSNL